MRSRIARITRLASSFSMRQPSVGTMRCDPAAYMPQSISRRGAPSRSRAPGPVPRAPTPFCGAPAVPSAPAAGQPTARRVGRDHLVAVVVGLLHAQDGPQSRPAKPRRRTSRPRASLPPAARRKARPHAGTLRTLLDGHNARSARMSQPDGPRTRSGCASCVPAATRRSHLRPARRGSLPRAEPSARVLARVPSLDAASCRARLRSAFRPLFSTTCIRSRRPKLHYSIRTERTCIDERRIPS